jgi:AraC-like DNA-binding protein
MGFTFEGRPSDSPFIEKIWFTRTESEIPFFSTAEFYSEMVVTKYQGKLMLTVRGPETNASFLSCPPEFEAFGIVFKLGTFMPHLPPKLIMNRADFYIPEASPKKFWLQGAAWEFPTFENVDTFISRLVQDGLLAHDPIVNTVLQGQSHDLSLRTVRHRFLQATGVTQNTIYQIERAKQAAALLEKGTPIADVIFDLGYYDQPHMTRALKRFMGQTPAEIARENLTVE